MNADLGLLVLRVVVGVVVLAHGAMKLGWVGGGPGFGATATGFGQYMGFRPGWLWALVATGTETVGSALLILGLGGPLAPAALAADLVVVTLVAHWPKGFWAHQGGVEFPAPLAASTFAIALLGNGHWSLDAALGLSYPDALVATWSGIMAAGAVLALISRILGARTKSQSAPQQGGAA